MRAELQLFLDSEVPTLTISSQTGSPGYVRSDTHWKENAPPPAMNSGSLQVGLLGTTRVNGGRGGGDKVLSCKLLELCIGSYKNGICDIMQAMLLLRMLDLYVKIIQAEKCLVSRLFGEELSIPD